MTHAIAVVNGKHQVYRTVNGIYRLNVGPAWTTPKEACRYADSLNASTDAPAPPETPVAPRKRPSAASPHPTRNGIPESSVPLVVIAPRVPTGAQLPARLLPPRQRAGTPSSTSDPSLAGCEHRWHRETT